MTVDEDENIKIFGDRIDSIDYEIDRAGKYLSTYVTRDNTEWPMSQITTRVRSPILVSWSSERHVHFVWSHE